VKGLLLVQNKYKKSHKTFENDQYVFPKTTFLKRFMAIGLILNLKVKRKELVPVNKIIF